MDSTIFLLPIGITHYNFISITEIEIPKGTDPEVDKQTVFQTMNYKNGLIRNILVYKDLVVKYLKSCTTPMEFITKILDDINEYSLNYLNLKVIIDSDTNTAKIVDFDNSHDDVRNLLESNLPLEFKLLERGSIIRGASLGSQLPDKIKSAALYSINGLSSDVNGSALGRMFEGTTDSYLKYLKQKNREGGETDQGIRVNTLSVPPQSFPVVL